VSGVGAVTVGIPAYNGEDYLMECLESLVRQTRRPDEVLVFDDCSKDGTLRVAEAFAARHPELRMRVERNERNLGMAGNWGRVVEEARGDHVKILHQDDVLQPSCLEEQAGALERHAGVEVVTSPWVLIGRRGKKVWQMDPVARGRVHAGGDIIRQTFATLGNPVGQPTAVMFRAGSGRAAGPFRGDLPYYLDVEYWLRLLRRGNLFCCGRPLYGYRIHGRSATSSIDRLREERKRFAAVAAEYGLPVPDPEAPGMRLRLWWRDTGRSLLFRWAG
jgi:glycosyltransferase involved in cell wall biosynthesis